MYTTKDTFFSSHPRRERDYPLPDGSIARIRELSLRDRLDCQSAGLPDSETGQFTDRATFYASVVQRGAISGPGGALLFTPDDIPTLADMPAETAYSGPLIDLGTAIWTFSEADPDSFRTSSASTDQAGNNDANDRESDAGRES